MMVGKCSANLFASNDKVAQQVSLIFCAVIFSRPPTNVTLALNYEDLILTIEMQQLGSLMARTMACASSYMMH